MLMKKNIQKESALVIKTAFLSLTPNRQSSSIFTRISFSFMKFISFLPPFSNPGFAVSSEFAISEPVLSPDP